MKTLLDPACRTLLLTRLRGIPAGTPARWGVLTAPRMLAHLGDSLRQMLGELCVAPRDGILRRPIVKPLVMYWLPWPKGRIKSSPELFRTPPGSWEADLAEFSSLLERFAGDTGGTSWPEHPAFGPMTHASWGRFAYRHFDHHLRQFGA